MKPTSTNPIEAELIGSTQCRARDRQRGLTVNSGSPILALCRALVGAGYDPARPLCVSRDGVLALKVRSIGDGARLRVTPHGVGFIWEADKHERQGRPLASRLQEAAE